MYALIARPTAARPRSLLWPRRRWPAGHGVHAAPLLATTTWRVSLYRCERWVTPRRAEDAPVSGAADGVAPPARRPCPAAGCKRPPHPLGGPGSDSSAACQSVTVAVRWPSVGRPGALHCWLAPPPCWWARLGRPLAAVSAATQAHARFWGRALSRAGPPAGWKQARTKQSNAVPRHTSAASGLHLPPSSLHPPPKKLSRSQERIHPPNRAALPSKKTHTKKKKRTKRGDHGRGVGPQK